MENLAETGGNVRGTDARLAFCGRDGARGARKCLPLQRCGEETTPAVARARRPLWQFFLRNYDHTFCEPYLQQYDLQQYVYDFTNMSTMTDSPMTDTPNPDSLGETLRTIKRSLRGVMNGPVSQSMREKGLTYKVNFGVELPRLRQMAEAWPHTYDLAAALWKEDIRECRLLAAMLMPAEAFDADLADLWVEQMRFVEEAECTVFHLFSHLPYASSRAFAWIARDEQMFRLVGWLLLGRLFANGATPSDRDADEMIDQAMAELPRSGTPVARAAYKALMHYAGTGDEAARRVDSALDRL